MTTGIRKRGGYEEGVEEDRAAQEVARGCQHGGPGACGCMCYHVPCLLCAPVNVIMCFFALADADGGWWLCLCVRV